MQAKKPVPANKREVKNERKAFGNTNKTVKPVAKDTNATRRKDTIKPLKGKIKKGSFKKKASNEPKNIK